MVAKCITIDKNNKVSFNNNVDYCIGTGRMGLALQREYFNQLKLVQEKIGFSHIRGHGLFSDDMAIYHEYRTRREITMLSIILHILTLLWIPTRNFI